MNGAQDLGGMMGFGPIAIEPDEPVFHDDWERRAFAVTVAAGACGLWNLDITRHTRESLPPADYLAKSYYDIWITALGRLLQRYGLASAAELATGHALEPPRPGVRALPAANVATMLAKGTPYDRPVPRAPLFQAGDRVGAKLMNPATHTRLPRYARGKTGVVEAVRGSFVFPDANAHGLGEDPHWCYTVVFTGRDLWGPDADPSLVVSVDLWEPYLERA